MVLVRPWTDLWWFGLKAIRDRSTVWGDSEESIPYTLNS